MGQRSSGPLVLALKPEASRLIWVFSEMLYGLLFVAWELSLLSATDSAVGSVIFLQQFGQYFTSLVSLQERILLRTPEMIQLEHEHLKPWICLSFLGSWEEVTEHIKKSLVWLQTNQGTRQPLHFSGDLSLEQSLLGDSKQIFLNKAESPLQPECVLLWLQSHEYLKGAEGKAQQPLAFQSFPVPATWIVAMLLNPLWPLRT